MSNFSPIAPGSLYLPDGRLDLTVQLGRNVATATDVLQVIRPELRLTRAYYRGVLDAARDGWLETNPDLELTDSADRYVSDNLFDFIWASAVTSVGQWATDVEVVFDKARLREFIREALVNAMVDKGGREMLPEGALDY